jgi:hypothetical protein
MVFHPEWANRGLAWIEAFDNVPLMAVLQTMVDLDLFRPSTIGHYLFMVLRRRLAKVFEPPKQVKPPRKASTIKKTRPLTAKGFTPAFFSGPKPGPKQGMTRKNETK